MGLINSSANLDLIVRYKTTIYRIYQKFQIIDENNIFLNNVFEMIFECLNLYEYKYDLKSCEVLENAYSNNIDKLKIYFDLILFISNQSNDYQIKVLKNIKIYLNFIAFLEIKHNDLFKCQLIFNKIINFIRSRYNITYNYDLIIKHKLYGYKKYIFDEILNDSINEIDFCKLNLLKTVENDLVDEYVINLILKLLENSKRDLIQSELRKLFWSLFDKFSFNQRKSLVYNIYDNNKFNLNINGAISCLVDKNFKNNLNITINQISASSFDDQEVYY